jgi:hypothetical protein
VHIIRYHTSESRAPLVGVRDEGQVFGLPGVESLAALWALPLAEIRQRVAEREAVPPADVTLLPPVDGRGRQARRRSGRGDGVMRPDPDESRNPHCSGGTDR